jgi:dUTP pyrophosphatase
MTYRFYVSEDVDDEWEIPQRATTFSAGFDLRAYIIDTDFVEIAPGKTAVIRTGVSIAMPPTSFGMIVSRSGLAIREGLIVLNAPGIIDADYNYEMCVILHNTSVAPRRILHRDRIAQIVFMANDAPLDESIRSARTAGFGSTGKQ